MSLPPHHRTIRGTIRYTSDKPERMGKERGREYFMITDQSDGTRIVHAHCEIDDAPDVIRDVVLALRPDGRPLDASVRLTVGGRFEGTAWMRFNDNGAECESFNQRDAASASVWKKSVRSAWVLTRSVATRCCCAPTISRRGRARSSSLT